MTTPNKTCKHCGKLLYPASKSDLCWLCKRKYCFLNDMDMNITVRVRKSIKLTGT